MKIQFIAFLLLIASVLNAQKTLTVLENLTLVPIENAQVYGQENGLIGVTNNQGEITLPNATEHVTIVHPNYVSESFSTLDSKTTVYLQTEITELNDIIVKAKDNKALKLIQEVIKNQKLNSPKNLPSYSFNSYTKFTVDVNKDSIPYIKDPVSKRDSAQNKEKSFLEKSLFFISERAIQHKFKKGKGEKNEVVAARISGLKSPFYEVIAQQPISYEFNQDYFGFLFTQLPNPISKFGMNRYHYYLKDTLSINGRNLIKVIFKTKKSEEKNLIGHVLIDQESKALAKFIIENRTPRGTEIELNVEYKPYETVWIPVEQIFKMQNDSGYTYKKRADIKLADGKIKKDTLRGKTDSYVNIFTYFSDFKSPAHIENKELRGFSNSVKENAFRKFNVIIDSLRYTPLTTREFNTYEKIDSIGQEEKIDKQLKWFRMVSNGLYFPLGPVEADLKEIVNFNKYENVRVGASLRTNYKFSKTVTLKGGLFYGFKDEKFKYHLGADFLVNKYNYGKIITEYWDDIHAAGRFNNLNTNWYTNSTNKFLLYFNELYFREQKFRLGYQQDNWDNVNWMLSSSYGNENPLFNVQYKNNPTNTEFTSFATRLDVRWAPKEEYIITPLGKTRMLGETTPVFYFNFTKNWKSFGGDYAFGRMEFAYLDQYNIFPKPTQIVVKTGLNFSDTPIWQKFSADGNVNQKDKLTERFGIGGFAAFETMSPGEFFTDRYVSLFLKQTLLKFKIDKKSRTLKFAYNSGIGAMSKPELSTNFSYKTMDHLYQEVGLELHNIISVMGLGAYYRVGHYNVGDINKDLSVKFTLQF